MLIGANDLAANMGHLGDTRHPEVAAAFDAAGAAIMATGRAAGFQFFDERAETLIARGFTLAAVAGDINALSRGMAASLKALGRSGANA
jgi:2-keto-3-deoxy-L-rhamnonate aldolase RhmA